MELGAQLLTKIFTVTIFIYSKCGPRISDAAAEKLKNRYILMRSGAKEHESDTNKRINIPITVRYLM